MWSRSENVWAYQDNNDNVYTHAVMYNHVFVRAWWIYSYYIIIHIHIIRHRKLECQVWTWNVMLNEKLKIDIANKSNKFIIVIHFFI